MNEPVTLDQKLKAIEIAVAMSGPIKKPEHSKDASGEMALDFIHYGNLATLILEMAHNLKES